MADKRIFYRICPEGMDCMPVSRPDDVKSALELAEIDIIRGKPTYHPTDKYLSSYVFSTYEEIPGWKQEQAKELMGGLVSFVRVEYALL